METGGLLTEQLLDASALEHIHNGDWTSQVNNQLRQHGHQNEPESVSREDRLRRDSPAQNDHSDERSGAHTPKRSRDELPGNSTLEPPRQHLATSSAVESRTKSPAEAGSMPAAKMSSEEVDRKCKELRAHWHQKPCPSAEIAVGVVQAEDKVKKTPGNVTKTFSVADRAKRILSSAT
ncbi:hypothetical protein IW148_003038 [Coemansia sp. RSA 1199]|nr:hypothetical protein IW148_003038 [Coemansia sp. RSA 1199]